MLCKHYASTAIEVPVERLRNELASFSAEGVKLQNWVSDVEELIRQL